MTTCTGAGDNYVGKVYGVVIKDEDNKQSEMHVVVKTPPGSKARRDFMRVGVFFQNEAIVYEKILPALTQYYHQKSARNGDTRFLKTPR